MRTFAQKSKATQQTTSAKSTIPGRTHLGQSHEVNSILHVQRTIGNQAVQRLLRANSEGLEAGAGTTATDRFAHDFRRIPVYSTVPVGIQTKLKVNTPGDIDEQEADRVSEAVMCMADPGPRLGIDQTGSAPNVQRCSRGTAGNGECGECKSKAMAVQRVSAGASAAGVAIAPAAVHDVLRSPGQPLDAATREFMEPRFGHGFSEVRVHVDAKADDSARAMDALAYTVGRDVVFGAGRYAPHTFAGRQLIAHELTHVLQQGGEKSVIRRAITYPAATTTREDPIPRILRNAHALALTTPTVNGRGFPRETDPATTIIKAAFVPREYRTIGAPSPSQGSSGSGAGSGSGSGSGSGGSGGTATGSECAFKDFDVKISANMMLPTDPSHGQWGPDYVDASALAGPPSICAGKRHIEVTLKGKPDTATFFQKIKANEQEHVTDLIDASNQYLVPYYQAIMALRGKGQDSDACKADLQTQLGQVPENRVRDFHAKVVADVDWRDTPGRHPTQETTRVSPDCSQMQITAEPKPAPNPAAGRTP
jgi:uncharacterized membrane protein YgcG